MYRLLVVATIGACCLVASSFLRGQTVQSQPQRPPSDAQSTADENAHTNYVFIPLDQNQKPTFSKPLSEIVLPEETASTLQIVRPRSDLSNRSTSERLARFAMMTGQPAPPGAEIRAHTNYEFLANANHPPGLPLAPTLNNTPREIRSRYGLPDSGGGLILIVDGYDYPTVETDLATFSSRFELPVCSIANSCLQVVKMAQNIRKDTDPRVPDCGWSGEAALDIQWAHAIAPQAKLVLVEAISSRKDDMFAAVDKANEIAENSGGGVVSLSWSYDEFGGTHIAGEAAYDQHFQHDSILYFVSSGDQGGWVEYPSASPFVVSVGGTELLRDANNSVLIEQGWSSSGGGSSNFELLPPFQANVENTAGTRRVTPDIAGPAGLDATGANGSPSYAGTTCEPYQPGWYLVGGTSLATPIVAAAANLSYPKGGKTITILQNIYKQRTNKLAVRDITAGQAGTNIAMPGYDKVTGVGVPASTQFVK